MWFEMLAKTEVSMPVSHLGVADSRLCCLLALMGF